MNNLIENADRILNELEKQAFSASSNAQFLEDVLKSLQALLNCDGLTFAISFQPGQFVALSSIGQFGFDPVPTVAASIFESVNSSSSFLAGSAETAGNWLACPLTAAIWENGFVVASFKGPLPPVAMKGAVALMQAFCEVIAIRQLDRFDKFMKGVWNKVQEDARMILSRSVRRSAQQLYVTQLCALLGAARVSLFRVSSSRRVREGDLLAISNAVRLDKRSSALKSICAVAGKALCSKEIVVGDAKSEDSANGVMVQEARPADGMFESYIATKIAAPENANEAFSVIVLEWIDKTKMVDALPALSNAFPFLTTTWIQQDRWLAIPRWIRVGRTSLAQANRWLVASSLVRFMLVLAFLGGVFWGLFKPTPLIIEADAILEPSIRRAIYSNVDGNLEKLLISDGQQVEQGQALAVLRSPTLDLEIEESIGQIRAIGEKRNGLRVAISQISSASSDASTMQARLSSEILLLDEQEKHAKEKLDYLNEERKKLEILSPIGGVVVARNLERELKERPLRRGDSLFNVVDLSGDWQLHIRVADRDSGYVLRSYAEHSKMLDFVYDSIPSESFQAEIGQVGSAMENPDGTKSYLSIFAKIPRDVAEKTYMGANARVKFHCGDHPFWFVWCRPILETVQQRYGYFLKSNEP